MNDAASVNHPTDALDDDQRERAWRLIKRLVESARSPQEVAEELDFSLEELASFAASPEVALALEGLARLRTLAELQAQYLLSRYRAATVLRLASMTAADEPSELARRSCVDFLKLDLARDANRKEEADANHDPPPPTEEAILAALAALGEED